MFVYAVNKDIAVGRFRVPGAGVNATRHEGEIGSRNHAAG